MSSTDRPINGNYRRNVNAQTRQSVEAAAPLSFPEEPLPPDLGRPAESSERPAESSERPARPAPATICIHATLDGFAFDLTFSGRIDQLPGAIERLRAVGASPAPAPDLSALPAPIATPDDLPDGWKLCPKHHAPMRPRNKQGDVWHSHNVGTREHPVYCKGYKGADSPGYDL